MRRRTRRCSTCCGTICELRGAKFGCGLSQCGACSVLVDGKEIRSCVTPVAAVVGRKVTTLEGLPAWYAEREAAGDGAGAASAAAGLDRRAGSAVRLLPERDDHHGRRPSVAERAPERCGDQAGDGSAPLPVRDPQRDRACNQACRDGGGLSMGTPT